MVTVTRWRIHPTAIIDPTAEIDPDVEIGPYCIIGPRVRIRSGTILHAGAHIVQNTRIGRDCQIHSGAILGGPPQDHKFRGEETYVEIGNENILRECVTIHRATGEENVTRLGERRSVLRSSKPDEIRKAAR